MKYYQQRWEEIVGKHGEQATARALQDFRAGPVATRTAVHEDLDDLARSPLVGQMGPVDPSKPEDFPNLRTWGSKTHEWVAQSLGVFPLHDSQLVHPVDGLTITLDLKRTKGELFDGILALLTSRQITLKEHLGATRVWDDGSDECWKRVFELFARATSPDSPSLRTLASFLRRGDPGRDEDQVIAAEKAVSKLLGLARDIVDKYEEHLAAWGPLWDSKRLGPLLDAGDFPPDRDEESLPESPEPDPEPARKRRKNIRRGEKPR